MVYTIGIEHEWEGIGRASVEEALLYLNKLEWIGCDSETLGFDCHRDKLLCLQLGDFENQYVIGGQLVEEFRELLENSSLLLHNAKFDLKFLYKRNIWPKIVYDTMLAEGVLFCGIKTHKKALNIVAKERLGVDLDKSVRAEIWKEGLTQRVVEYAADDVKYLEQIKNSQALDLEKWKLFETLDIENQYVLCLAYIEFCGIGFDKEAWAKKCENDEKNLENKEEALNQYVIENNFSKFIDGQLDLFSTEKGVKINWASSKQVVEFFKFLKVPVIIVEDGKEKESVEAKHIDKYKEQFPFIKEYIAYKEADKVVSTYGRSWLNKVNDVTGRIHTSYQQIMDTGRISSGNKKEGTPNLQNIPADKTTRGCFIAEEGNDFIVSDFTAQEDMIFVEYSREPKMIEFYNDTTRKRDGHSFVAKMCFPKQLEEIEEEQVKEKRPDLRDAAKKAKFSIHYGGVGATIAANVNIPLEEGNQIYSDYMIGFPGIASYFKKVKAESLKNGYILISPRTGRKSFIWGYDRYKQLNREIDHKFWDRWKVVKANYLEGYESSEYVEMKEKIRNYFNIKGEIEKKALNYPIQGTAGETTKLASIYFFEWLREKQYFNIVKIVNTIHDEVNLECPEEYSKESASKLEEVMAQAGDLYCTVVKLRATAKISKKWEK